MKNDCDEDNSTYTCNKWLVSTNYADIKIEIKRSMIMIQEVQKALGKLNKAVIVIAHRMRTVANAEHLIVLDKGCVVEEARRLNSQRKKSFLKMTKEQAQAAHGNCKLHLLCE